MRIPKLTGLIVAGSVLLAACSTTGGAATSPSLSMAAHSKAPDSMAPASMAAGAVTDSDAANLRVSLDELLGEHIILAAKATGAALGGRSEQFAAYGDLLNTNGTDIGAVIGSIYGRRPRTRSTRSGARTTDSSSTTPLASRRRTRRRPTRPSQT